MLTPWQKRVKCEMIMQDIGYDDLAKKVGTKNGYLRQLLCDGWDTPRMSPTKKKINEVLGLEDIDV